MLDGKVYSSKQALRADYKRRGLIEVGVGQPSLFVLRQAWFRATKELAVETLRQCLVVLGIPKST